MFFLFVEIFLNETHLKQTDELVKYNEYLVSPVDTDDLLL